MTANIVFMAFFTFFCVVVIGFLGLIIFICQTVINICEFVINTFLDLDLE